jgi:uncharacterized protein (TIGR02186 family)
MRGGFWLALILLALPVRAEEIVSGVSQSGVSINTDFNGTSVIVYGAALREAPPPKSPLMDVIITVEGPPTPLVIRKKEQVAGIWLNRGAVIIASAPSFYAMATTTDLASILSPQEDAKYNITIPRSIQAAAASSPEQDQYIQALQRVREASGTYVLAPNSVLLLRQTLFRTEIALPANLVEGRYKIRIFLTRGGQVIDMQESQIEVQKTGIERALFRLALEQPLVYGILSLIMAIVAGWGAQELFKRLRI